MTRHGVSIYPVLVLYLTAQFLEELHCIKANRYERQRFEQYLTY